MNLSFVTEINGIKTFFPEKILSGLRDVEVNQDIANFYHSNKYTGVDVLTCLPKLHTIRIDDKNKWKSGNKIHFKIWTGKPYNSKTLQFAPVLACKSVQKIKIGYKYKDENTTAKVFVDNKFLGCAFWINCQLTYYTDDLERLINNDGFDSVNEFFEYFDKDYQGKIIHWTDLKY